MLDQYLEPCPACDNDVYKIRISVTNTILADSAGEVRDRFGEDSIDDIRCARCGWLALSHDELGEHTDLVDYILDGL